MTDLTPYDVTRQSPDVESLPQESDPRDRPPQQVADAPPTPDPNVPPPAFPLPEELDPASPTRQSPAQID